MATQRFLGAAWASAHGPGDPARLVHWLCEARFAGVVAGPSLRAIDWPAVRAAAATYPLQFPAVRVTSPLTDKPATAGFASKRTGDQQLAFKAIEHAVALARRMGTAQVIVEPGIVPLIGEVGAEDLGDPAVGWSKERAQPLLARRKASLDAALDAVCRNLFAVCRANPDFTFCLTPGRSIRAVAGPDALAAIFEDLPGCRLAYWHDAAVVARREQVFDEPQGRWLEGFSNRCIGATLGDAMPEGLYLPPGAGGVDYPLLVSYLAAPGKATTVVLELDPAVAAAELPGVRACLEKFGL